MSHAVSPSRRVRGGWIWAGIRGGLIVFAIVPGATTPSREATLSLAQLVLSLMVSVLIGIAFTFVLLSFVYRVRWGTRRWMRPSWFANPFFGEPAQFFHAAGWFFTAAGAAEIMRQTDPGFGVLAAGMGLGLLCGLHLYVRAFPHQFIDAE